MGSRKRLPAAVRAISRQDLLSDGDDAAKERQHHLSRHRYSAFRSLPVRDVPMSKSVFTPTLCLYGEASRCVAAPYWAYRDARRRIRDASRQDYSPSISIALAARAARDDIFRFFLTRARVCISETLIERAKRRGCASRYTNLKNILPTVPSVQTNCNCSIFVWAGSSYGCWVTIPTAPTIRQLRQVFETLSQDIQRLRRGRVESLERLAFPYPSPSHSQVFSLRPSFLAAAPGWWHISPALTSTNSVT